jgi:hypothetical protein
MALRILAGIVNITRNGPKSGVVRIRFNPHERISGDVGLAERRAIGPAGRFIAVPAKHVALRQINLMDTDSTNNRFTVNDEINRDRLVIRWSGTNACFSEEISYLVAGEVPDPVVIPLPPGPIRPRRRTKKRRRA